MVECFKARPNVDFAVFCRSVGPKSFCCTNRQKAPSAVKCSLITPMWLQPECECLVTVAQFNWFVEIYFTKNRLMCLTNSSFTLYFSFHRFISKEITLQTAVYHSPVWDMSCKISYSFPLIHYLFYFCKSVTLHALMFSNCFQIIVIYRPDSNRHLDEALKLVSPWRQKDHSEYICEYVALYLLYMHIMYVLLGGAEPVFAFWSLEIPSFCVSFQNQ